MNLSVSADQAKLSDARTITLTEEVKKLNDLLKEKIQECHGLKS